MRRKHAAVFAGVRYRPESKFTIGATTRMPLLHSFGILNRTEFDYLDGSLGSSVKTHLSERVQLHDDLLHYFGDSLLWIPSFNPSRKVEQVGINFWGLTVITIAGAEKAAQVFGAWKDLFIQSPEELTLTGPFTWEERDEAGEAVQVQLLACATTKTIELPEGAHQAVLEFERDEVVNSLEKLSSACKRVAKGDGSEYLLHMGIEPSEMRDLEACGLDLRPQRQHHGTPMRLRWMAVFVFLIVVSATLTAQTPAKDRPMMHATGPFDVKLTPQKDGDDSIGRMTIDKQFHGDLEAHSVGQMLSAMGTVKGSAGYVAIEKVSGTLHGQKGIFVLQHNATMDRGKPMLNIIVIPDSGTGELEGLTGSMTIDIAKDGKHSYNFRYQLPDKKN